ncbi:MAG: CPBP family intramembrane metalloprotease [Candidatus Wallbacteria bacterium]|nr:CPBP family intramembrane metalloprotease [Candidatus Wallbacteria bacterium]
MRVTSDLMLALRELGLLKWRHLVNFLRVQGSSWQTLMRAVGAFLMFAFLRFVTLNILETFRGARSPGEVVFLASSALAASLAMLWVFDLLVFVADEFQLGTDANDFEFLLSLPLPFGSIVWAKVLLRAGLDLVGLSTMMPVLVATALHFELPWHQWPLLYAVYFVLEVAAGLAAVIAFFGLAQVLSLGHLETLRLLIGFALPFAAGALVSAKERLLAPQAVAEAMTQWGGLLAATPIAWMVGGLAPDPVELGGSWPWPMPGILGGFAGMAAAGALAHAVLTRMQGLATSLVPRDDTGAIDPVWLRLLRRTSGAWTALAIKELVIILRRRVTFITVVLLPLGIVAVNALTVSGGAAARHGQAVETLTISTMLVPLLFLPYMTAAQSLGQIEYARIPFLQGLPLSARSLLEAKAVFWTLPIFLLCEAVHLTFLLAYGRWNLTSFLAQSFWLFTAAALVTVLAVATAALFPVSENALFKQQGATLTAGSLFYLTGSLGAIVPIFPLTLVNKLVLLGVTVLYAHVVLDRAAERIAYFDEIELAAGARGLRFGDVFIAYDAYISLYLLTNIGIAFLTGIGAAAQLLLTTVALLLSQAVLAGLARSYLALHGHSIAAIWTGRWGTAPALAAGFAAGALAFAPFAGRQGTAGAAAVLGNLLDPSTGPVAWLFLTAALATGPVAEELFFRGLLLRALTAATGRPVAALAVSAVLFAVPHYITSGAFLPALVLGGVTAVTFLAGGGLTGAIAAHVGFNATSLACVAQGEAALLAGTGLTTTCLTVVALVGRRFTKAAGATI